MTKADEAGAGLVADGGAARRGTAARAFAWAVAHPVAVTALIGVPLAAAQLRWVSAHRGIGGLGVDEVGFVAASYRFDRALGAGGPAELWSVVLQSPTAPLVPLLSVPVTQITGRSLTAAFVPQALLYVLTAVAVAGIVRRVSSRPASLAAGLITLGLPVSVVMARYSQLASAVTAFLALAVWALLASERGTRRGPMLLFGGAVGALLLSRAMAVTYLPALVVALGFVVRGGDRRTRWNVGLAAAVAVAMAAPWWLRQWGNVSRYLFSFGYGRGAEEIESVPLPLRIPIRLGLAMHDVRPAMVLPALVVAVASVVALVRWRQATGSVRGWPGADRGTAAVWLVVAVGLVVLLSSSNSGTWFQAPLETLSVAGLCALAGRSPGRWQRGAGAVALAAAACNVLLISVWLPGAGTQFGGASVSTILFGGVEDAQVLDFAELDPRFAADASAAERRRAEDDWAAATDEVATAVEAYGAGPDSLVLTMLGEVRLMHSGTFALRNEVVGRQVAEVESTLAPESRDGTPPDLRPRADGRTRVLVSVRPRPGVPERVDPDPELRRAAGLGWESARRIQLPAGATAVLYVHPDTDR